MIKFFKRLGAILIMGLALPQIANAAPETYLFDYNTSEIGFTYSFNGETIQGKFPEFKGDLVVDFTNVSNSSVTVDINAAKGKGGFVFATSALRGPRILDTVKHPFIKFVSTSAKLSDGKATVNGRITVRGVTKPTTLQVRFFQLEGQDPTSRDELKMTITGSLNRHDFGASGYPDMVGDMLNIKIDANIKKQ